MLPVEKSPTTEQSPRELFWSLSFLWAPVAAFLAILVAAYVVGRGPGRLFLSLANLALVGCVAALTHAIFILWRSRFIGRAALLILNVLALVVSCIFGSLPAAALLGELMR